MKTKYQTFGKITNHRKETKAIPLTHFPGFVQTVFPSFVQTVFPGFVQTVVLSLFYVPKLQKGCSIDLHLDIE